MAEGTERKGEERVIHDIFRDFFKITYIKHIFKNLIDACVTYARSRIK